MKRTSHKGFSFAKAHAYVFYVLRRLFKGVQDDGFEDQKAVLVMGIEMGLVALTLVCIVSILLRHRVPLLPRSKVPFIIVWGGIYTGMMIFNQYSLVSKRQWTRFQAAFERQSPGLRTFAGIAVWVIVALSVAAAAWAATIALKLPST